MGDTRGGVGLPASAPSGMVIDHDDAEREDVYRDEKAPDAAQARARLVVSMRHDVAEVFLSCSGVMRGRGASVQPDPPSRGGIRLEDIGKCLYPSRGVVCNDLSDAR